MLTVHELDEAQVLQGPDGGGRVWEAGRHDVRVVAGFPVLRAEPVAGVGEGWGVLAALLGRGRQVPAHVVSVQVGHHHHVNLVGSDAVGLEVVHQLAPGDVRFALGAGAHARVHQDGAAVGTDEVGRQVEAHPVPVHQMLPVALPLFVGLVVGEKIAQVKLKNAVGQRSNFHVPDTYAVTGHSAPPAEMKWGKFGGYFSILGESTILLNKLNETSGK